MPSQPQRINMPKLDELKANNDTLKLVFGAFLTLFVAIMGWLITKDLSNVSGFVIFSAIVAAIALFSANFAIIIKMFANNRKMRDL